MYLTLQPLSVICFAIIASAQTTSKLSIKRGLVFTPNPKWPQDDKIWKQSGNGLTWYYNYGSQPSPQFDSIPQSEFEFVPMIWGAPSPELDNGFLNNITELIANGRNITHILTFNEPDGSGEGSSNIHPKNAAQAWLQEIIPLQEKGIKIGAPAMQFPGLNWLNNFTAACTNCTFDFIPLHFYGTNSSGGNPFDGFKSHIKEIHTAYPNAKLWITEFADVGTLEQTQTFFNATIQFLDDDNNDYIERYSYFGAFRSTAAQWGPNTAFLDANGNLTDIGSWYLGGAATNNTPGAPTTSFPSLAPTHTHASSTSTPTHTSRASSIYYKSKEELGFVSLASLVLWSIAIGN